MEKFSLIGLLVNETLHVHINHNMKWKPFSLMRPRFPHHPTKEKMHAQILHECILCAPCACKGENACPNTLWVPKMFPISSQRVNLYWNYLWAPSMWPMCLQRDKYKPKSIVIRREHSQVCLVCALCAQRGRNYF